MTSSDELSWRPTPALRRGTTVVALALLAAVGLGRPDLIVIAAPLAVGTFLALAVRPTRTPSAEIIVEEDRLAETEELAARVRVTNPDRSPVVGVVSAVAGPWLRLRHGFGRYVDPLPAEGQTSVSLRGTVQQWGHHLLGPVRVHAIACDGLLRTRAIALPAKAVRVFPAAVHFDSRLALPWAAGMTGIHRSRRAGDGGELAEVRPFQPGDRLRRIDWRVTMRRREPYVATTLSERDAEITIVIDVLHNATNPGSESILDVTVRAAAAIAEHYVHQGDRVSIVEFGPRMRRLRPGTGRRQYLAALEWLSDTRMVASELIAADRLVSGGHLPHGSVVIMLTPLIDERATAALARLARSGRNLMTVDTLPDGLWPPYRSPWSSTAARLWYLGRDNTIGGLRELGVPVAGWRGPGSLDHMLADIVRIRRAPRIGAR